MKKLYSQMTEEELELEMKQIQEEMKQAQFPSQKAVLERKYFTAKAYTLKAEDFPPGVYKVDGHQLPFELEYVNGMMAWGTMGEDREASFPISMLSRLL